MSALLIKRTTGHSTLKAIDICQEDFGENLLLSTLVAVFEGAGDIVGFIDSTYKAIKCGNKAEADYKKCLWRHI